jgi:hypothetical protein
MMLLRERKEVRSSFFEKKEPKKLCSALRRVPPAVSHQTNKVFFASFLFTKKKILSCLR